MSDTSDANDGYVELHGKAATIFSAIFLPIFFIMFFSIIWCSCGCPSPSCLRRNRQRTSTYYSARPTPAMPRTNAVSASNTTSTPVTDVTKNGSTSVISSQPSFSYRRMAGDHSEGLECPVCLAKFQEGEKGRLLMMCGHSFHAECVDQWLKTNSTCPVCRSNVQHSSPELPV